MSTSALFLPMTGQPEESSFYIGFSASQAPEGESQPSTEVDLFISTEKIMVLNTDLKVISGGKRVFFP